MSAIATLALAALLTDAGSTSTPAATGGGISIHAWQDTPTTREEPLAAPAGRLDALRDGLGLELAINNDKPELTVSLGRQLSPATTVSADGLTLDTSRLSWSVDISAPISGKDDITDQGTIDKLTNGTEISATISRFSFSASDAQGDYRAQGSWQVGATVTVGLQEYDYRTPLTLAEQSDNETSYGVEGFLAYFPTDGRSLIAGGLEYRSAFEAQDSTIQCKSVVVSPTDDCAYAPPGPPEESEGVLLSLEYRRTANVGWSFGELAASPKVVFDTRTDDTAIDLPVYIVPNEAWPIMPGLKVSWSSKDDETTFGLFLKTKFSFGL